MSMNTQVFTLITTLVRAEDGIYFSHASAVDEYQATIVTAFAYRRRLRGMVMSSVRVGPATGVSITSTVLPAVSHQYP